MSKHSANPEVAADLVMVLTACEQQKRRAIEGSCNPTIAALCEDAGALAAVPFTVWVPTTFMGELTDEPEGAARIDGATPLVVVRRVFLPVI